MLSLVNWCAYMPRIPEGAGERLLSTEVATSVSFLPAISRRRLSRLSKLSLRLALECTPGYKGYCVFGSQHGELVTTQGLLESIVQGDLVSPAGFSASVHNTAVGLHSIHNQNTYPCTSIAAGRDTLAMCFMEAYALIQSGAEQVLVVYADDTVPAPLDQFIAATNQLHGFAALVRAHQDGPVVELAQAEKQPADKLGEPLDTLIAYLLQRDPMEGVVMSGEVVDWRWQYHE